MYRNRILDKIIIERITLVDNSTNNDFDRLLSGTLVEYNGTSLMKFANHGLCPCSFFGMSDGKEILGSWAFHDYLSTCTAGRCKIIFTQLPTEEKVVSDILKRIEEFKGEMDSYSSALYKSLIEDMSLTVEGFIQNMNENKDEIEEELGFTLKKLEI